MSLLQSKVLLFYVFAGMLLAFSAPGAVDSAYVCNRTCPTSSSTTVPYPFGFSDGCGIRMNCSELGDIFLDEFRVLKITQDSILVNVPASCNRPIETLQQLYGKNFAPSLRNVFLVANCSHPSLSSCPIKPNLIDALLSLKSCEGTTSNDIKCISDGLKPVSDLVDYAKAHGTDCRVLFSGMGLKQNPSKIGVFELEWWLDGPCICSPNADCVLSSLPRGETGHRCQCNKGFKGDGYPDSLGCIQDRDWIKTIVICVVLGGLLILGLPLALWIWHKRGNFRSLAKAFQDQDDLELPIFNLDTIVKATNNFSPSDKIGEGGYGPVFKGKLELGQEIAVKRLSKSSKQGLKEFMNEVSFIAKLQHRNLVKLLGCCMEGEERLLVYEYMPNKSLDSFIFDRSRADCEALNWARRVHIINGIVRGLVYLHHDSRLRIIHRDLKASNVLLDSELNPKISDFGLAKSFGGNETEGKTNKVVGTHGYMSPEYVTQGHYSIKSDVYSFGVIVLEIISGKRNGGFVPEEGHLDLLGHAWRLYTEGRYSELIDASIGDSCSPSEAERLIHIGLLCIQYSPEDRPSMSTVALMLGGESKLPRPKQPGFYSKRDLQEAKSSSTSNQDRYSVNKVTMTTLEAR